MTKSPLDLNTKKEMNIKKKPKHTHKRKITIPSYNPYYKEGKKNTGCKFIIFT